MGCEYKVVLIVAGKRTEVVSRCAGPANCLRKRVFASGAKEVLKAGKSDGTLVEGNCMKDDKSDKPTFLY